MSQSGKLMPNLDQKSTKLLNLTVLQRIDPFVEEILITAAHVTLYHFNIDISQWSRKDVEGSLFVVKRNTQPRFQFIVMNRRNTENLVEDLLGDFKYEIQEPYLLYRNAAQEVNGIWFYDAHECEEVANLFGRILNAYAKVPAKSKRSSSKSEYEEVETVPGMAIIGGPLEPSPSTTTNIDGAPDDRSFVNFFSLAIIVGNTSVPTINGELHKPATTVTFPNRPANIPPRVSSQVASNAASTSPSLLSLLDTPETSGISTRATNLVKPSSFSNLPSSSSPLVMVPLSSSLSTAPPLQPPSNIQRSYATTLLQPFPPPTPPPSLTPTSSGTFNCGPVITRDKDDQFVDMVCQAILNAHHS
uniref:5'-(N(7)-methyl 5'-triphosphoguanosine)-[mRNA] diphosphatase n=1 Tax=Opuntia streptacantha TaxID=393608 RepID=A0A7C9A377_OPUST